MLIDSFIKELEQKKELYLTVKVTAHASVNKIIEVRKDNTVKIAICAPAEHGRANKELIRFLAKTFALKKEGIQILSGYASRLKLIKISK